jgi:hypothetical protein
LPRLHWTRGPPTRGGRIRPSQVGLVLRRDRPWPSIDLRNELRPPLLRGLETLESRGDFGALPELFAAARSDAREMEYLGDALAVSLDQLIRDASPDARRLLRIISLANESVSRKLVTTTWLGEDDHQRVASVYP